MAYRGEAGRRRITSPEYEACIYGLRELLPTLPELLRGMDFLAIAFRWVRRKVRCKVRKMKAFMDKARANQ